ncbi:MAG: chromate transporter, partial [Patescibacteria group bacterium]|nr:chromate transporter [Patescibacteria group bacterium]
MRDLVELYAVFFRIGLFSIGGGYVMLPMLRREMVESRDWLTDDELMNYYAIGQATPGIIAINTATFVGYKRKGIVGGIAATLGMVTPSLIIITLIAALFARFQEVELVQRAFKGIRVAVAMLLVFTVWTLFRKTVKDAFGAILCLGACLAVVALDVSPIPVIVIAGLCGLAWG